MKKYTYSIFLFVITLFIVAGLFGVYFLYQKVQSALHTQERMALEQEIQEQQLKNLPELSGLYYRITESEHFFSLLYPEDRVVEVIKDIERLAKEQALELSITQREVPKKKAVTKKEDAAENEDAAKQSEATPKALADTLPYEKHIRLELQARGQYQAIRNFLHALETAPYALDILALHGGIAPPKEGAPVRPTGDNPFLLQSTPVSEETVPTGASAEVLFVIETALYTQ